MINDNDIIGKKFERLTIIERTYKINTKGHRRIFYLCLCDCGNYKEIFRGDILNGKTKSCGCLQKEKASLSNLKDLTGMNFGKLTVVKRVDKPVYLKDTKPYWLCKCECGSEKDIIVTTGALVSGNTKSCGCLLRESTTFRNKQRKKYNTYDLTGEYGIGYTSKGEEFYFDLEDYDLIKDYCWFIHNEGYIVSWKEDSNPRELILFHRLITNCSKDKEIDHINGIRTRNDNRKYNLRICTHQKNLCNYPMPINNTSGRVGVYWKEKNSKWWAEINYKNKTIFLGYYINYNNAVKAREEAELKYFKEYRNKDKIKIVNGEKIYV